jgi:hypothetical protein
MPLAIIGLVCPEARVKFKNIDFRTVAILMFGDLLKYFLPAPSYFSVNGARTSLN